MSFSRVLAALLGGLVVAGSAGLCGCGDTDGPRLALDATPAGGIGSYRGGTALWVVEVGSSAAGEPIAVTASSVDGVACEVVPPQLAGPGSVEVIARPGPTAPRRTVDVVVRAQAGDGAAAAGEAQLALPLQIMRYNDFLDEEARRRFELFSTYLAAQHPEFGLTPTTPLEGWNPVPNILVVMWYSFLSADCEALIRWHVMIPPYDWTEVFLRRRGSLDCVWAGKIPTAGAPVEELAPPDVFPRFEAMIIPLGSVAPR